MTVDKYKNLVVDDDKFSYAALLLKNKNYKFDPFVNMSQGVIGFKVMDYLGGVNLCMKIFDGTDQGKVVSAKELYDITRNNSDLLPGIKSTYITFISDGVEYSTPRSEVETSPYRNWLIKFETLLQERFIFETICALSKLLVTEDEIEFNDKINQIFYE